MQSTFDAAGPEAAAIVRIAWWLFGGGLVIFVAVMALAAMALYRPGGWLASRRVIVGGGIVFPVLVLTPLLIYVWLVGARPAAAGPPDLAIEVTGEQWWWRVHYLDADGRVDFATANEIRVPVGRSVELRLRSADVLHSFWVPAIAGKLDMIPGRDNRLRIVADRAGRFRGQCAEYCGGPHAWMAFFMIAEEPSQFEAWRTAQRQPQQAAAHAGRRLFESNCAACHTVRGTAADGQRGPDLTHFASRVSLGAALLPNSPGSVAGWIASNQHLKPGNLMPEFRGFSAGELEALAAYLGTLD